MIKDILILTIILFLSHLSFGQDKCDTLSPEIKKQFDAYSVKQFDKLKNTKKLEALTALNAADYFRNKSDTSYKEWYRLYISLETKKFSGGYHDKTNQKYPLLFYMGKAYYYLEDFKTASSYFNKAFATKCQDKCLDYYSTKAEKKMQK